MDHPFGDNEDDEEEFAGNKYNDEDYTIMSCTSGLQGEYAAVYGPRDILALRYQYGTDGLNGEEGVVFARLSTVADDTLRGGDSNDNLWGLDGNDTLTGGQGADNFIIKKGDGSDLITDAASEDAVKLGPDIAGDDLGKKLVDGNLAITLGDEQNITLAGWETATDKMTSLTLNDGSTVNFASLPMVVAPVIPPGPNLYPNPTPTPTPTPEQFNPIQAPKAGTRCSARRARTASPGLPATTSCTAMRATTFWMAAEATTVCGVKRATTR